MREIELIEIHARYMADSAQSELIPSSIARRLTQAFILYFDFDFLSRVHDSPSSYLREGPNSINGLHPGYPPPSRATLANPLHGFPFMVLEAMLDAQRDPLHVVAGGIRLRQRSF